MLGHYNPYLRLFETMNQKYGLDNYSTPYPEFAGLFNKICSTKSSQKYCALRPDQIVPYFMHDALNLVFEIEELWQQNNYKPEVILMDQMSLTGRILSKRNKIPSVSLFAGFPLTYEQNEVTMTNLFKIMDANNVELLLNDISMVEQKYGIEVQKYSSGIPQVGQFGAGDIILSVMPANYPFIQQVDLIYTGPMFRVATEELDFDFTSHAGKKFIFISMGTLFNNKVDFFTTVIASCLKYLTKDCIILISMMNQQVKEIIDKSYDENELKKNGIFIKAYWNQIKVLERVDLFVSHCGNNSYLESLSKAVPILGYPQAADQIQIADEIKRLGFGDILPQFFDEEIFYDSVKTILFDPSYKQRMIRCIDWFDSEKSLQINLKAIEQISFCKKEEQ